ESTVRRPKRRRTSLGRRITLGVVTLAVLGVVGTGAALWLQGYRIYVVHTGSMTPTYRPGDVVVDGPADRAARPGEVITFRHSDLTTDVVTHRVVNVTSAGITTKGDANRTADAWTIRPDQVKGQVRFGVHGLGYLMVYLRQPSGIGSIATVTIAILLLWRLFFPDEEVPPENRTEDWDTAASRDSEPAPTPEQLVAV
ncbi:MAG: signal peptidase I, partial [Jatrophihabitantaceae bacterium]